MGAEDTVMIDKQIQKQTGAPFVLSEHRRLVEAQAEISFKAGVKEAVGWINEHSPLFIVGQDIAANAGNEIQGNTSYYPIIRYLEWKAKLKEWQI